jgi:arginase family enzyme
LTPLPRGIQHLVWRNEIALEEKWDSISSQLIITPETAVIFSLDADALNGAEMPGVSAVNGNGLSRSELEQVWKNYRQLIHSQAPIMGIYELNPVYDTLSALSVRTLATFVYEALMKG